ncbi:MAG: hypothetical protein GQ574_24590 [Crocinitomix sp.]|nr:hypothetical protein [Crocinitomix sp.]
MANNIEVFSEGVLRTPMYPFQLIKNINKDAIFKLASDQQFQEAIALSSYDFYSQLKEWLESDASDPKKKEKIYATLYKYIARASARSTPFGLFGTLAYLSTRNTFESVSVELDDEIKRDVQVDGRLLKKIVELVEQFSSRNNTRYYLNNTIYSNDGLYSYYEQKLSGNEIFYTLSRFEKDEVVTKILDAFSPHGKITAILTLGLGDTYSDQDLLSFVDDLIAEKILISEFDLFFIDSKNLSEVIQKIQQLVSADADESENELIKAFEEITKILLSNGLTFKTIESISQILTSQNIKHDKKDLIHLDARRDCNKSLQIADELKSELLEARELLLKIHPPIPDSFEGFKTKFFQRYEYRTMNLIEVLDAENGIGFPYEADHIENDSILKTIQFPHSKSASTNHKLTGGEVFLLNKIIASKTNHSRKIDLSLDDVSHLTPMKGSNSFNAFFTLLDDEIWLNSFTGNSATQLISRFAHLDERIDQLCADIVEKESENEPDKILAEITHIPELKSANLIPFKNYRAVEIPCLFKSKNKTIEELPISDIYVRLLQNRKVELISKKYQKVIIPKLSNALNYSRNSIPLYKFLCALESQDESSYQAFTWNQLLPLFDFFPRVVLKKIVLSPALWKVAFSELSGIELNSTNIKSWRIRRKIDEQVYLSTNTINDNKLYIDFGNEIAVNVFLKELKKHKTLILFESLAEFNSKQITNKENDFFLNEIVLPCYQKTNKTTQKINKDRLFSPDTEHVFIPGSEWLSLKIYLDYKPANDLLSTELFKTIGELVGNKIIQKWFFVRYYDDDFHIRLRFQSDDQKNLALIYSILYPIFNEQKKRGLIHNIVIDSYKRENERYKAKFIQSVEEIFFNDSHAVCQFHNLPNHQSEIWIFALLSIDYLLEDFGLNFLQKRDLLADMFNGFFKEFHGNKPLLKSIDKNYRERKKVLFTCLNSASHNDFPYIEIVSIRSAKNKSIIEKMLEDGWETDESEILPSIIHMNMNRLFVSNNRKNEMVIYYFLFQYYKSKCAIMAKG